MGNLMVGHAIGLAASDTGEVYVVEVLVIMATADTILLMSSTIIDLVQQLAFHEQPEGTEQAGMIHVRHQLLHICQGEGSDSTPDGLPHQNAYRGWPDTMFLQMLLYSFHVLPDFMTLRMQR